MCTLRDKLWLFSSHSYLRSIDKKHQGVTALDITRHSYYKACRGPSDASVAYVYLKLNATQLHAFTHTQTLARLALELQRSSSAWIVDLRGTHREEIEVSVGLKNNGQCCPLLATSMFNENVFRSSLDIFHHLNPYQEVWIRQSIFLWRRPAGTH